MQKDEANQNNPQTPPYVIECVYASVGTFKSEHHAGIMLRVSVRVMNR